jgi:hypothetical protein
MTFCATTDRWELPTISELDQAMGDSLYPGGFKRLTVVGQEEYRCDFLRDSSLLSAVDGEQSHELISSFGRRYCREAATGDA